MDQLLAGICQSRDAGVTLLSLLRIQEQKVSDLTQKEFNQPVATINEAVGVVFAALLCCAGDDKYPVVDRSGRDRQQAIVTKMMRHARAGGSLGLHILDLTLRGHYSVAFSLIRTLIEESTKAAFYASFPGEAVKHLSTGSKEGAEADYLDMAKQLGWDHKQLGSLYGGLSKFVHATPSASFTNLLFPEFNRKYSYVALVTTVQQMRTLLKALLKAFPNDMLQSPALSQELLNLIQLIDTLEANIDRSLYELTIVSGIRLS